MLLIQVMLFVVALVKKYLHFFILPFTSRGISGCFEWKRIQPGESDWQCSLHVQCE